MTQKRGRLKPLATIDAFGGYDFDSPLPSTKPTKSGKAAKADDKPAAKKPIVEDDDEAPKSKPKWLKPKTAAEVATHVVDLDKERKLTKKQKIQLEAWQGAGRGKQLDILIQRHVEGCRKKFGHHAVMMGSDTDKLVLSIPMYGGHGPKAAHYPGCLPMEYVLGQDGFLLGLCYQIVAKYGVGKSAKLAEIMRWFNLAGGGAELEEAEDKFNPIWYRSIMGDEEYERMIYNHCTSVEDWQRRLTFGTKSMQNLLLGTAEEPGPGRTVPFVLGVDSIMGKSSEETQENILGAPGKNGKRGKTGTGNASRGFPIEALVITRYMRTYPGLLSNWPFSLVLVNHLRINKDDAGNTVRQKAGGEQVNFQESFELELKKVGGHKKMIRTADWEGFPLEISNEKNSFGVGHRKIQTRLIWWYEDDPETGKWKQKTIWDWDWATVHMLWHNTAGDKADPGIKANLADMGFHLSCPKTSDIENLAWSKTLGMKEGDAMPWSELGALIREDAGLMNKLRDALRIVRRPRLKGDYLQQLNKLAVEAP